MLAGRIVKKYRVMSQLSKDSGLGRRALRNSRSKQLVVAKGGRQRSIAAYQDQVLSFYLRDENSQQMPGKADKVRVN